MFRVPSNPDTPTFDETFKVGFFRWLTSKADERKEWMRRRNAAAKVAAANQNARFEEYADGKAQEHARRIEEIRERRPPDR